MTDQQRARQRHSMHGVDGRSTTAVALSSFMMPCCSMTVSHCFYMCCRCACALARSQSTTWQLYIADKRHISRMEKNVLRMLHNCWAYVAKQLNDPGGQGARTCEAFKQQVPDHISCLALVDIALRCCMDCNWQHGFLLADELREACWEALHTGHWRDVPMVWRDLYSLACCLCVLHLLGPLCFSDGQLRTSRCTLAAPLPPQRWHAAAYDPQAMAADWGCTQDVRMTGCGRTAGKGVDDIDVDIARSAAAATAATAPCEGTPALCSHAPVQGDEVNEQQGRPVDNAAHRHHAAEPGRQVDGAARRTDSLGGQTDVLLQALYTLDMAAILGGHGVRISVNRLTDAVHDALCMLCGPNVQSSVKSSQHSKPSECAERQAEVSATAAVPQTEVSSGYTAAAVAALLGWPPNTLNSLPSLGSAPVAAVPLPPGSLQDSDLRATVPRVDCPSLETFLAECMCSGEHGQPTILTGCMQHWPALLRWRTVEHWLATAGLRTVPVEVGKHYLEEGWGTKLMRVGNVLRDILTQPPKDAKDRVYLAQHALLDQITKLRQDIAIPDYCCLGLEQDPHVNAWVGPAGTVTPLHTDPPHNLLAQVAGSKYVRLYSPCCNAAMFPCTDGLTTNSSQVDLDHVLPQAHAAFEALPFMDTLLQPGEMLYIPPMWWHYVKAMSSSASVSFWWK